MAIRMGSGRTGWPEGWTAKQRQRWVARGGTKELAAAFAAEGWSFRDIDATFKGGDGLREPAGLAGSGRWAALLGDDLSTVLELPRPNLDDASELWCGRRHLDGRREVWELKLTDGGVAVTLHAQPSMEDPFTTTRTARPEANVLEALEALDDPRMLSGEVITVMVLGEDSPAVESILEILRVAQSAPAPESGWPDRTVAVWGNPRTYFEAAYPDITWHTLWSSIGGLDVNSVVTEFDTGLRLVPVLCDIHAPALVPLQELATTSWYSESGGAPISWDGGNALWLLNGELGLDRQWGDSGAADELFGWPSDNAARAQLVSHWIVGCDAQVVAAFTLQPFDPDGTLSDDEVQHWKERIAEITVEMIFDLEPAVLELAAELLMLDPVYARTAGALSEPLGPEGQLLSTAIDRALTDGVIGELTFGDWDAPS